MLSPSNDLYLASWQLRALGTSLIPGPTVFTQVDELKVGVRDLVVDLTKSGIASVVIRGYVTTALG